MPHYKAVFTPARTFGGKWRSHLRSADVVYTAKDDDQAYRIAREQMARIFVTTADDCKFNVERLLWL